MPIRSSLRAMINWVSGSTYYKNGGPQIPIITNCSWSITPHAPPTRASVSLDSSFPSLSSSHCGRIKVRRSFDFIHTDLREGCAAGFLCFTGIINTHDVQQEKNKRKMYFIECTKYHASYTQHEQLLSICCSISS